MTQKSPQLSVANRLALETSPYLLSHADNPVDWYPWGDEAFAEAKRRGVPIFLSIGYSACHWCHVMAHESFENPQIAQLMNQNFVNIKVDREELPTIDALYMQATQALTGQGGWPMSVWLDHERRPWYAGTYFPPIPSHASPSFGQVLIAIDDAWRNESQRVGESAERLMKALSGLTVASSGDVQSREDLVSACSAAVDQLAAQFDPVHGGFGGAPKFPPALVLKFLMRWEALARLGQINSDPRVMTMVDVTCEQMARSGLYDQVGFGFSRYCVDAKWTIPHFEKMLYDNAQLLDVYSQWWLLTNNPLAQRLVSEIATFLIVDLNTTQGGFAAALDADSEDVDGHMHEGAHYVWNPAQIAEAVGQESDDICRLLSITETGNFERGFSVPQFKHDASNHDWWIQQRALLKAFRDTRAKPFKDDKIVASWNAMAISALARASRIFQRPDWLQAASQAADYLANYHLDSGSGRDGILFRSSRNLEVAKHSVGTLEDYALVAQCFFDLAQASADDSWQAIGQTLVSEIVNSFTEQDRLIDLPRNDQAAMGLPGQVTDITDNVTPSGWSAAVEALLTCSALTGDAQLRRHLERFIGPLVDLVKGHGRFSGNSAALLVSLIDGPREVAIVSDNPEFLVSQISRMTSPGAVYTSSPSAKLMAGRKQINGADTVYICRSNVCQQPMTDVSDIRKDLGIYV